MASKTEIAWLAGLIDGEGSIMLTRHAHSPATLAKQPHLANYPRIRAVTSISNTCMPLLQTCVNRFGGRIYHHKRPEQENHKALSYTWRMDANMMRRILPLVQPWLIVKHDQCALMLEALALKEDLTPRKGAEWRRSEESYPRLVEIQAQISALNRKGRFMHNEVNPLP